MSLTLFDKAVDEVVREYDRHGHQLRWRFLFVGARNLSPERRSMPRSRTVALNQFINVAVAEKLSAIRTEDYFRERALRGPAREANFKESW